MQGSTQGKRERAGPLTGFRVLELGSTVAGPFCGRLLADFGAQVIKIEPPEGDPLRTMGKQFEGKSLYAASLLRNRELVSIDLRSDEGRALVARLAASCDCLIENFRPGTLEKWGLGYDTLSARHPGLVMVRISGFGQSGPYRERPGYGVIGEAVSGLRHVTGDPDRPPARVAVSLTDYCTGLYAAFGATMALLARERTGVGQCVDAALYESAFSFMEPHVPAFDKLGFVAGRTGSRLPDSTPNNLYVTQDGEFIHITAMGDAVFRRLVQAMQQPALADDPRFASGRARSEHHEALDALIGEWTGAHALADLEFSLQQADVPATRIFTMRDVFADPHFAAREMLVEVDDDTLGTVRVPGIVPKLSGTPGGIHRSGGAIGRDTHAILRDVAQLGESDIAQLAQRRVIRTATPLGKHDTPQRASATVTP
jgi:crotonobetainyl-CoA:carnitine CoA-transferase CaiB-like acyl-CoA transferase